jgi:hypothetical protein
MATKMIESDPGGFRCGRAATVVIVVLTSAGLLTQPASGQTSGEAHVVSVRGGDSSFQFGGVAGGGGVLFGNRLGVDGEYGGARLRFRGKLAPVLGAGFVRLGDIAGPYVGGGANIRVPPGDGSPS